MSPSAEYYDLCHEDTYDLTGQIFRVLRNNSQSSSFSATVPPHLSEASVAHWDGSELW